MALTFPPQVSSKASLLIYIPEKKLLQIELKGIGATVCFIKWLFSQ